MKKQLINSATIVVVAIVLAFGLNAFTAPDEPAAPEGVYQYMQVTTIESIIPAGLGRSRMFMTDRTGKVDEWKMKNLYSMVGIHMGNITENDAQVMAKLNEMESLGWELYNITTGVQSPGFKPDGGSGDGIYMTRYLFRKR